MTYSMPASNSAGGIGSVALGVVFFVWGFAYTGLETLANLSEEAGHA